MDTTSFILLAAVALSFFYVVSLFVSSTIRSRSTIYDLTSARNKGIPSYAYPEVALCRVRSTRNFNRIIEDESIEKGQLHTD